jgi:low affinity Fe/Cu permease
MVFLIQNSQNRDARSLHLKVDELLRAMHEARTGLVHLEDLSDADLNELDKEFKRLGKKFHVAPNDPPPP